MSHLNLTPETATDLVTQQQSQHVNRQFELFNICWAISTLFHLANHQQFAATFWYALLTMSAIFLLAKPSSVNRLILLVIIQFFQFTAAMPSVVNHWIFTAFVNLTILQAVIYQAVKTKTFVIDREVLLKYFAPVLRVELMVFYFYVVFHKLNSGFFTPEVSCATDFILAQDSSGIFSQNKLFLVLNAYLTIALETIIPLLLVFRRTRYLGLLIGILFHCVLAFNPLEGFYDFSSMIFAIYILFTTQDFTNEVYRLYDKILSWKDALGKRLARFSLPKLGGIILAVLVAFGILAILAKSMGTRDYFREFFWSAFNLVFIIPFLFAMVKPKTAPVTLSNNLFRLPSWSFLLFPILVFLNGLSPYLGLKTENSFAMFSNLRTEGGETNHYIVPVNTQIFDYQKDLVEIVSSTDPILAESVAKKELMVYFEFKNYIQMQKPERIEYIRNGQRKIFEYQQQATHGDLLHPEVRLLRKMMSFRKINKIDPMPCLH